MQHIPVGTTSGKRSRAWAAAAAVLAWAATGLAAEANCPSNCESRLELCLKEARSDAIRDKCRVYFKGCLKTCTQGK